MTYKKLRFNRQIKQPINWTEKHQSSLDSHLIHVTLLPILAFHDFQLSFILHNDGLYRIQGSASWLRQ